MTSLLQPHTSKFQAISLDELNARAALLDREENKYLLTAEEFISLTDELSEKFDILAIDGQSVFTYRSTYFDSQQLIGYTYHHQGRTKRRFKVRTRQYVESGLCYFEVKLKNKRGGTIKKRIPYQLNEYGQMTEEAYDFLRASYRTVYRTSFRHTLTPQMEVNYSRITLVSKTTAERMTIDFNLEFRNDRQATPIRSMLIVETKSADGKGIADALFRRSGIRSKSCSKFCLGANLLKYNVKHNRFKQLLSFYDTLPVYTEPMMRLR
jgi:hypothetical protein